jgi:aromatic ring-opening dioxygenase LigB subunit
MEAKKYATDPVATAVLKAKGEAMLMMRDIDRCCRVQHEVVQGPITVRVEKSDDEVRIVISQAIRGMTSDEVAALVREQLDRDQELANKNSQLASVTRERDDLRSSSNNGPGSC